MADVGNASVTVCARFRPENDIEREAKGAKAVTFAEVGGMDAFLHLKGLMYDVCVVLMLLVYA